MTTLRCLEQQINQSCQAVLLSYVLQTRWCQNAFARVIRLVCMYHVETLARLGQQLSNNTACDSALSFVIFLPSGSGHHELLNRVQITSAP